MAAKVKTILAWIFSILTFLMFLAAGVGKFIMPEPWTERFIQWGYSAGFVYVVGAMESLAGLLAVIPRTAFYGGLIGVIIMVGATYTHITTGIGTPAQSLIYMLPAGALAILRRDRALGLYPG